MQPFVLVPAMRITYKPYIRVIFSCIVRVPIVSSPYHTRTRVRQRQWRFVPRGLSKTVLHTIRVLLLDYNYCPDYSRYFPYRRSSSYHLRYGASLLLEFISIFGLPFTATEINTYANSVNVIRWPLCKSRVPSSL